MKRIPIVCLSIFLAVPFRGGVPEPDTVLYGKVVTRVGEAQYQLMDGDLRWTIASSAESGRIHSFNASLEPLADGLYSYRINIPHELLAYDLMVSADKIPLTAGLQPLNLVKITVDGFPARVVAPAENFVGVRQSTRGMTHEVDLEVEFSPLDSDGDGLPDWLEDRMGLDKWNPNDAPLAPVLTGTDGASEVPEESITTFAAWRAIHFPGTVSDLDVFAHEDTDRDGIPNLEAYGFVLEPKIVEIEKQAQHVPRAEIVDGEFTMTFRIRTSASDLSYIVEMSDNLSEWTPWDSESDEGSLEINKDTRMATFRQGISMDGLGGFVRVRLMLNP